ncbi:DUF262 domain-containing HNH endonuclease family protein [Kamptonema sp. UHCC 0994]|uniref:DUF262 domain-containing protein n=1 Tax=Kamptonema sp. UHCC 0994 TaxID=3031329 RepID=UPI0023BA1F75|nr:DUF262 domain-containing HNH endonuclease family protein [Kamptonema sp. UHCC 0994]MDF0553943.1 DUF262 domain-containing HNH endonuclease family protein [Kamptonema sp. UHCC 0994]
MKADSWKISKVFSSGGEVHYIMPHFQRQYSWEKTEWEVLLKDAIAIYEEYDPEKETEHFIGSLVVINDGTRGTITAFKLVDGQQRLTTLSLLFLVLRDIIKPTDPKLANKINKFVVNSDEEGEGEIYFKLLPTNKYGDRQAYQTIILGEKTNQTESGIPKAYDYFYHDIESKVKESELDIGRFFTVLQNCFQVVFIELNKNESPYHIFESLNAKGKPLTQPDLVRNYMAMMLPTSQQETAFTKWEKIEKLLQEERKVGKSGMGELTAFIRHYLAMETRNLCAESHIYARFRDHCKKLDDQEFLLEIANLLKFAEYYNKLLRPDTEVNQDIKTALIRLNTFDLSTAYPFLLMLYDEYNSQKNNFEEFIECLKLLENYLVRRHICAKPTNSLTRMFPSLWKDVEAMKNEDEEITLPEALQKVLITKEYPNDNDVRQSINSHKLYDKKNPKKMVLVIDTINRHLSKGTGGFTVLDQSATIEHILPQTPREDWKNDLGDEFKQIYRDYLHTLGNLTLVTSEWNIELSNSQFWVKKPKLAEHALRINSDYFSQPINRWDDKAILERANFLSNKFIEIWPSLGEHEAFPTPTSGKPKLIKICGEEIALSKQTSRQVTIQCCEWVIQNRSDSFEKARKLLKPNFRDNRPDRNSEGKKWQQLSNGYWVNLQKSSDGHKEFCRRFLEAVGISETDWSIEYVKD